MPKFRVKGVRWKPENWESIVIARNKTEAERNARDQMASNAPQDQLRSVKVEECD